MLRLELNVFFLLDGVPSKVATEVVIEEHPQHEQNKMATDPKPPVGTHASNYRDAGSSWDAVPTKKSSGQSQKDIEKSRYDTTAQHQGVEPIIWKRIIAAGRHLLSSIPNPPLDLEQGPTGVTSRPNLTQGNVVCHNIMDSWEEQIDGTDHQFSFFSISHTRSTSNQKRTEASIEWM